jgi:hypothetical protein
MLKIFFFILNYFPLFSVTKDDTFGGNCSNRTEARYSLLRLSLGTYKIYFVSYKKDQGFKIWYFQKMEDTLNLIDIKDIEAKEINFGTLAKSMDDLGINNCIDFLKSLINELSNSNAVTQSKASMYIAINAIIFSVFIYFLSFENLAYIPDSWISKAVIILLLWSMITHFFFILKFYSVRDIYRSTFKDLKNDPSIINLSKKYYFNWLSRRNENLISVSYIKNIQESFLLMILLMFCFFAFQNMDTNHYLNNFGHKTIVSLQ